jgi:L-amino acid N-acyltransferase YncA
VIVRPAVPADAPALAAIYGHDCLHGTGTFEEEAPSAEEMAARLAAVQDRGLPWLVAEAEGAVVAFAYAGPYRARSAYRYTVEDSVYVAPQARGRGAGRAVLRAVIDACRALGLRQMVAVIGDSSNAGSIGLHRSLGFQPAGQLDGVGFKHGRWLDVVLMILPLDAGEATAPKEQEIAC